MFMHELTRRRMLSAVALAAASVTLPGCGTSGKPLPLPEGDRVPVNAGFQRIDEKARGNGSGPNDGRSE